MPSSTSASDRGRLLGSVLVLLVALGLGLGMGLSRRNLPMEPPLLHGADPSRAALLVVGNSVAEAAIDPERLGADLGDPRGVTLAVVRGGGPIHLAAATHRLVHQDEAQPQVVLIYALASSLRPTTLDAEQRARVMALGTADDLALRQQLFGGSRLRQESARLMLLRDATRDRILRGLASAGAGDVGGRQGTVNQAFSQIFPAWSTQVVSPTPPPPDPDWVDTVIAPMVQDLRAKGIALWLVPAAAPPGDPGAAFTQAEARDLEQAGARVLPTPAWGVTANDFRGGAHLGPELRDRVTDRLAEGLGEGLGGR